MEFYETVEKLNLKILMVTSNMNRRDMRFQILNLDSLLR